MRTATIAALLLAASLALADEVLVPDVVPTPSNVIAQWRVTKLVIALQPVNRPAFAVEFTGVTANGTVVVTLPPCAVYDSAATQIASTMNILNLTSNSLTKRLIAWGQTRGCIAAGAVQGTPGINYLTPTPTPTVQ
jgi:hypothetical protein